VCRFRTRPPHSQNPRLRTAVDPPSWDGPSNPSSPVRRRRAVPTTANHSAVSTGCLADVQQRAAVRARKNTYLANPPSVAFSKCFAHCGDRPSCCRRSNVYDGNALDGDGCDSTTATSRTISQYQISPAWTCVQPPPGSTLTLPRDLGAIFLAQKFSRNSRSTRW